jgi:hypothetical protein
MIQIYLPEDPLEGETYHDYNVNKSYMYCMGQWEEIPKENKRRCLHSYDMIGEKAIRLFGRIIFLWYIGECFECGKKRRVLVYP